MDKQTDFEHFFKKFREATANVSSQYFKLKVACREEEIFRERVYCYELYHQLRCLLGDSFPYQLDGELDKNGHSILQGKEKPDFVIHFRGQMDKNLAVIEVKSIENSSDEINKDLGKFKELLKIGKYYKAIMLIYGNERNSERKINQVGTEVNKLGTEYKERVLLVWHNKPGEQAEIIREI
jgi:hypothetical protein